MTPRPIFGHFIAQLIERQADARSLQDLQQPVLADELLVVRHGRKKGCFAGGDVRAIITWGGLRNPRVVLADRNVCPTLMNSSLGTAVVLFSGGLDSATTLAIARSEGFACHALTFRYGQRHAVEIDGGGGWPSAIGVARHRVVEIDLRLFGGSALTERPAGAQRRAPTNRGQAYRSPTCRRGTRSFCRSPWRWPKSLGASDIFIGVNALDYSGYPDCRPEYIAAFERMANLATKAGVEGRCAVKIHTPLIQLTKAEIIRRGLELGVDYALDRKLLRPRPDGRACGHCDSCLLRLKGFAENLSTIRFLRRLLLDRRSG